MAKIKALAVPSADKDVEQLELAYFASSTHWQNVTTTLEMV
jgi:hypothetical protein